MPRRPRQFVNGAIYHVYCRTAHGAPIFSEREEARRLLSVIREVRDRDGLSILAWCIMSNHYHLALRTGRVPLWRSMRLIQGRSSVSYCGRKRLPGPLWQGRYKAKLITDQGYCVQAVAYIHRNPVVAGLVRDPAAYRWSGHAELLGRRRPDLVDVAGTLALYGETTDGARIGYLATLRGPHDDTLARVTPFRLPWWRCHEAQTDVVVSRRGACVDALGASSAPGPGQLAPDEYLGLALEQLKLGRHELEGRRRPADVSLAREAVILVGAEQFAVRVNDLARELGMHPGSVSRALERASGRRLRDLEFAAVCSRLERGVEALSSRQTELSHKAVRGKR